MKLFKHKTHLARYEYLFLYAKIFHYILLNLIYKLNLIKFHDTKPF